MYNKQLTLFHNGSSDTQNNEINLHDYDVIIINSSAGKDSAVSIYEICRLAHKQSYSRENIHVSHQELAEEWQGTKELAQEQAEFFGLQIHFTKRRDKSGREETLLEYVERRGKWPSNKQRYCTSDFKRGPGARVINKLAPGRTNNKVLYVFGFRAEESPGRSKKEKLSINDRHTTKAGREVWEFLPVHGWSCEKVWETIFENEIPYHWAYDKGMPRLSCCFCIFSPFEALVTAGYENPDLLDKYVEVEQKINHRFRDNLAIEEVQKAVKDGYKPEKIEDWTM